MGLIKKLRGQLSCWECHGGRTWAWVRCLRGRSFVTQHRGTYGCLA